MAEVAADMPAIPDGWDWGEPCGRWTDLSVRTEHHGLPSSANARVQRRWVTPFNLNRKMHGLLAMLLVASVQQATAINRKLKW